ncbi:MAG: hypothetical protein MAG715_00144 [Methanonatronarchaeales archaeon]|nr:hypothetical protein [Methanonatronarchaeales archaeon]
MTEFERDLVRSFNDFFEERDLKAVAYRRKQHRFSSQVVDVLVDSLNPDFYLAIENKSISTAKGAGALYFSQHFTESQIPRLSGFLERSGRRGFLAVELKRGTGRKRRAFVVPWSDVEARWSSDEPGFPVDRLKGYSELERVGGRYEVGNAFEAD